MMSHAEKVFNTENLQMVKNFIYVILQLYVIQFRYAIIGYHTFSLTNTILWDIMLAGMN